MTHGSRTGSPRPPTRSSRSRPPRRLADDGITANALMPGVILTNLQRHMDEETRAQFSTGTFTGVRMKTPEQGAATSVLLAASPEVEGVSGRYFEDCNEAQVTTDSEVSSGVRAYALDPDAAQRLWEVSLQMLEMPAAR